MSDQRLRGLEHRYQETGSLEDEAAWLKERVRVGDLCAQNLEVTARLGYAPALDAVGGSEGLFWIGPGEAAEPGSEAAALHECVAWPDLARWVLWQVPLTADQLVRAIAATLNVAFVWLAVGEVSNASDGLEAVDEIVLLGPQHSEQSPETQAALERMLVCEERLANEGAPGLLFVWVANVAALLTTVRDANPADVALEWRDFLLGLSRYRLHHSSSPAQVIRDAIRAELVPWLLGHSDPVRDRVEVRQREAAGE